MTNAKKYDVNSALLCGLVHNEDKITARKVKSLRGDRGKV